VSWLGEWDIDLDAIRCPGLIWFGDDDTTPLPNGTWLNDRLHDSRLMLWPGEGHLAYKRHPGETFDALVATWAG
jgi:pimeloyl-ACP methyl ester carboxylesterase